MVVTFLGASVHLDTANCPIRNMGRIPKTIVATSVKYQELKNWATNSWKTSRFVITIRIEMKTKKLNN